METDDFALSDGPGYKAALCSKCGQIRPLVEFQRRMSKAYGASRGKVGDVGMVVDSSMCRACQPKPKRPSQMTAKELHNGVQSGDVHAAVSARITLERKAKATAKLKAVAQTAWDAARAHQWDATLRELKHEKLRVQQQEKYAKHNLSPEHLTYFMEYKVLLGYTNYRIVHEQRTTSGKKGAKPKSWSWQAYVDPSDWQKIRQLWEALPLDYRKIAKAPTLLALHPVDAKPYDAPAPSIRSKAAARQMQDIPKPQPPREVLFGKAGKPLEPQPKWDDY